MKVEAGPGDFVPKKSAVSDLLDPDCFGVELLLLFEFKSKESPLLDGAGGGIKGLEALGEKGDAKKA